MLQGTVSTVAPIVGAKVSATLLSNLRPEVVASTITDENGHYELDLVDGEGAVLIEVTGQASTFTTEPILGKPVQLSTNDRFTLLLPNVVYGEESEASNVNVWTTLIAARALWDVRENGRSHVEAHAAAKQLFDNHFGGIVFTDSVPVAPEAGPTQGLSSGALHGFVSTALAHLGHDLSRRLVLTPGGLINIVSLTQLLRQDLDGDGQFNSIGSAGPISVFEEQHVDTEFTRAMLVAALGSFITSAANKSGLGLGDFAQLTTAMSIDTSLLYGASANPPFAQSEGEGPRITITSPSRNGTVRDHAVIIGLAESASGVAGVEMVLDGAAIGGGGQRLDVNKVAWSETVPVDDGSHTLEVTARDSTGKTSKLIVTFNSDEMPPRITYGSCLALNDLRPGVGVDFNSASTRNWGTAPVDLGCTLGALQATEAPYFTFHSFGELMRQVETSSRLAIAPTDDGPIHTPVDQLVVSAAVYRAGVMIGNLAKVPARSATESTRDVALSSALFGAALENVSAADVLELRLTAQDALLNESSVSFTFQLDVLPTPLAWRDVTPALGSAERIDSYSFAAGNIQTLVDPSTSFANGMITVSRYEAKNVSDRPTLFRVTGHEGAEVTARRTRWHGLVVGQTSSVGYYAFGTIPELLGCSNRLAESSNPTQPADPYIMNSGMIPGVGSCVRLSDIDKPEVLTQHDEVGLPWRVIVANATSGVLIPANSLGEYSLAPGAVASVTVGHEQPMFESKTIQTCTPRYAEAEAYRPVKWLPTAAMTSPVGAYVLGGVLSARNYYSGIFSASGRGYVTCSGNMPLPSYNMSGSAFLVYMHNGSVVPQQDTAHISALSQLIVEREIKAYGSYVAGMSLRLPTNTRAATSLSSLPRATQLQEFKTENPEQVPSNAATLTKVRI